MRVYRIERGGEGAFTSQLVADARNEAAKDPNYTESRCPYRHPGPGGDPLLSVWWDNLVNPAPWHFGFRSLPELTAWFDCQLVRAAMKRLGGVVQVYEVDECYVRKGTVQVVFKMPVATKVDLLDIPQGETDEAGFAMS